MWSDLKEAKKISLIKENVAIVIFFGILKEWLSSTILEK